MSTKYNLIVIISFLEERVRQVLTKMEAEDGFCEMDPEYYNFLLETRKKMK